MDNHKDADLDIPEFLKRQKNEKREAWVPGPAVERPKDTTKPRTMTAEAEAFAAELAENKRKKSVARITNMKAKKASPDPKTHRWDTRHNIWVPLRIYKPEKNMRPEKEFTAMSGPELIQVHNEMIVETVKRGLPGTVTKRFASRDAGVKRCEDLYKVLCESQGVEYTAPAESPASTEGNDNMTTSKKSAKKPAAKKAKKAVKKAAKNGAAPKKAKKVAKELTADEQLALDCGVRNGSKHLTILLYLNKKLGEMVKQSLIVNHLYGDPNAKTNRLADLKKVMKRSKYDLKIEEDEKGNKSYGLFAK